MDFERQRDVVVGEILLLLQVVMPVVPAGVVVMMVERVVIARFGQVRKMLRFVLHRLFLAVVEPIFAASRLRVGERRRQKFAATSGGVRTA